MRVIYESSSYKKLVATTFYKNFSNCEWRRSFFSYVAVLGCMFMGIGMLSALIKLQETRTDMLNPQVSSRFTLVLTYLQIFIDCLAIFGVAYFRSVVDYSQYPRLFQAIFAFFAATLSVVEAFAPVHIKIAYYLLLCRPILNLALFLYLGDFMQRYVNESSVKQILFQGFTIGAFANTQKYFNNQLINRFNYNIFLFLGGYALFLLIVSFLDYHSRNDAFASKFKPDSTKFNAKSLVNFKKLKETIYHKETALVYLSVICFTVLNAYFNIARVKETEKLQKLQNTFIVRILPKSITVERASLEETPNQLRGLLANISYPSWKPQQLARANMSRLKSIGLVDQNNKFYGDYRKVEYSVAVYRGRQRDFVAHKTIVNELLLSQILQIILCIILFSTELFPEYSEDISGFAYSLVPFFVVGNIVANRHSLIESYHVFQAIDMAVKKCTKDYAYSKMDFETKSYLRMICELYVEPIGKAIGALFGHFARTYGIRNNPVNPLAISVVPFLTILTLLVAIYWCTISVYIVRNIKSRDITKTGKFSIFEITESKQKKEQKQETPDI